MDSASIGSTMFSGDSFCSPTVASHFERILITQNLYSIIVHRARMVKGRDQPSMTWWSNWMCVIVIQVPGSFSLDSAPGHASQLFTTHNQYKAIQITSILIIPVQLPLQKSKTFIEGIRGEFYTHRVWKTEKCSYVSKFHKFSNNSFDGHFGFL
jgi:hypothetical protein